MARLWFGGTPADFVIGQGADADIVDDAGTPTGDQGSAVLLPLVATAFDAYTDESLTTVTTDLLDSAGDPITQVTPSTDFATRGTLPRFQGPDGHEGALWLSADGVTGYRLEPDTDVLYTRLGTVEADVAGLATTDLDDWSSTAPADGQTPVWDESLGEYVPTSGITPSVINDLSDVDTTGVADGQRLAYDTGTSTWLPVDPIQAHTHDGSDITTGTVDVGRLPVGTNAWQVAAGNHNHSISGVTGLQTALDEKVNVADVAKVWPVIGAEDPTPVGAVDGDIIVRRQA